MPALVASVFVMPVRPYLSWRVMILRSQSRHPWPSARSGCSPRPARPLP
jgi:hypothetical protein